MLQPGQVESLPPPAMADAKYNGTRSRCRRRSMASVLVAGTACVEIKIPGVFAGATRLAWRCFLRR